MIENFTREQFEAALPVNKDTGAPLWEYAGERMGQLTYAVTPFAALPYAVLVYSSITSGGASSKEAGRDSIRAIIIDRQSNKPHGGKPVRWIDRRPGWQERLTGYLRSLANQISWLRLTCPACGGQLKPFTTKQGDNKGRPFVCCKADGCKSPFWRWTEDEDGNAIAPAAAKVASPVNTDADPCCPKCAGGMVRMASGKGYRCNAAGNTFKGGRWTVCDGTIWDNPRQVQPPPPARQPEQRGVTLAEAQRYQREMLQDGSEATAIGLAHAEGPLPRHLQGIKVSSPVATPAGPNVPGFNVDAAALLATVKRCIALCDNATTEMDMSDALESIRRALRLTYN